MAGGVFTSTDLESVRVAIMDLASGNAQLVQINGRMYRKSNLDELRRTYEWMKGQIGQTSSGRGLHRITFNVPSDQGD